MKKILSLFVAFFLLCTFCFVDTQTSFANNSNLNLTAEYALLMDYETGEILYEKNSTAKLYPASTTKAWTAYVVLKHVKDLNEAILIKDLPYIGGTSMYLKNGESFTVKELLYGLMTTSANDAAYILANYVSGSIEEFAKLMNKEARLIGATNTNFNNPHGLPDEKHTTTAYDMALMARHAMNNETFRNIVNTPMVEYEPTEFYPEKRIFYNTNKFLISNEKINYKGKDIPIKYDIVDGIKTGYTDDAGRCLLSSAVKNGRRVISAVFKANGDNVFLDSRTLIDYGLDNFTSKTIINKKEYISSKKILLSKQGKLVYEPKYSYKLVLPKGSNYDNYSTKTKLNNIDLPIKKGDTVGSLDVYKDNKLEHTIDLVAKEDVNSIFSFITESKLLKLFFNIFIILLVVIIILTLVIKLRYKNKKRKSYFNNKRTGKSKNIYSNRKNVYSFEKFKKKKRLNNLKKFK